MTHNRFFIEQPPCGATVRLPRDQTHHLRNVRRLEPGHAVVLFDGTGTDYIGRVAGIDRDGATIEITGTERPDREPDVAITLAAALVKQRAMDALIDACTQLGVARFIPIVTERSAVKTRDTSVRRWRRIAIEACKQCQRSVVPEVAEVTDLASLLAGANPRSLTLIASLAPGALPPAEALLKLSSRIPHQSAARARVSNVLCLVGPEGGFTVAEERAAVERGFVPISLGKTVLRTETASAMLVGFIALAAVRVA